MSGCTRRRFLTLAALLVLVVPGCPSCQTAQPTVAALPFEGTKLRLLIVGDPALATAVRQFQGEWKARTGAEFEIQEAEESALASGELTAKLSADAIIYPSYKLGVLADRKAIVPVPRDVLNESQFEWAGIFEALRQREATWDGVVYGIPFGSPVFVCMVRTDLFEQHKLKPPETWADYQRVAELLHDRATLGDAGPAADAPWCGAMEPLAPGWAGMSLLARAAPLAKHPDYFSALFDLDTMTPRIAMPPFVRALTELVTASKQGPVDPLGRGPAEVRAAFWRGECAMAISWPSGAKLPGAAVPSAGEAKRIAAGFAELPGAAEVFHPAQQKWVPRAESIGQIPLLSISGRLGSVTQESAHREAAFHLLTSLAGPQWSEQVSSASPHATLFRAAHVRSPRAWIGQQADVAAARSYANAVSQTLARPEAITALPIPGRDKYLAALDAAVQATVAGKTSPTDALKECADAWEKITDELGRQSQQQAYRRSVVQQP